MNGYEPYKEVIHEDAIRIESSVKAPDYCFRIGGTRKFFVEAKATSVNLKDAAEPAYQVRRYAWSAKLALSILTDFEEFAVYDCRVRPNKADKPSKARVMYLTYTDYTERWEEIASIFSRDAVLQGSFDKYAVTEKRKHGTAEVDVAFLAEIESWRESLAHNIALRNPGLSNRQLNYAVQITIDRIIFLRICEDRGIERYGELMALLNGHDVDNTQGWAEPYKEVIHEDAIRIESSVKGPDYCFRIGGTRKFFVEAKAPSVNVKDAAEEATTP